MQSRERNVYCLSVVLLCLLVAEKDNQSFASRNEEKMISLQQTGKNLKTSYSGGSGTEADPYQVGSVADWETLSATPGDWDKQFIVIMDIDFSGTPLMPVAPDTAAEAGFQGTTFSGVLDGNGHVLRDGHVILPESEYVGLFGFIGIGGEIRNLGLERIEVTGSSYVGGLAGYNLGSITSCYTTGTVTGTGTYDNAGGLAGFNEGGITSCYTTGAVTGTGIFGKVGGLVSSNWAGTITSCYASGPVAKTGAYGTAGGLAGENGFGTITKCYALGTVSGNHYVGGLAGTVEYGTVDSCYARGRVTGGEGSTTLGGLVGYNRNSQVTASYATGLVTGTERVGGLVGHNIVDYASGMVIACYASGAVSGNNYVGGLMGYNTVYNGEGIISSCYAIGTVSGDTNVGGLIGYNNRDNWSVTIEYCYATGTVTGVSSVGGLIGYDYLYEVPEEGEGEGKHKIQPKGITSSCYWDMESTTQTGSAGGFGRTKAEMTYPYAENTYEGWNFDEVWTADTDDGFNNGYPYLAGNTPCIFTPAICIYRHEGKCMTPECYTFSDCSSGTEVLSRQWAIDGVNRSTDAELYECFEETDTYAVTLTLVTECGVFVASENLFVEVLPSWGAYNAYFEVDTHSGSAPLTVQFTNLSSVEGECAETHWQWNFGDGIECWDCEEDSFTHTFPDPGTYQICLYTECYEWECKESSTARNTISKDIEWCETITVLESEGEDPAMHPADGDGDFRIGMAEAIAYLAGWQQGSNPMAHAIRAAYLWQNGEYYTYDPGAEPPLCWILETKTPLFPR